MFDFPDIPKVTYKRTFLRSSIFNIEFSENIKWENYEDEIFNFFKTNFPIKSKKNSFGINFTATKDGIVNLGTNNDSNAFELKSVDGLKILSFENNVLAVGLNGKSYESFISFIQIFQIVDELLQNNLAKYKVKRFSIRKINLIDFNLNNNNGVTFLKQLINSELIGNIDYTPNINYIKQSINSIVFEKESARLNIKYGYNKINDSIGQIILDLVMFFDYDNNKTNIDHFDFINNELYQAFNWAIAEEYKKIMNNG